ncbi:MAG: BrnT family toxin [Acidobacteriia bacterium]|nr:BrnT family toxin [Terriglobia bacterium]
MRFEFDATKSASNKAKHGIDFVEAQSLWNDPDRVEAPGRSTDEPRFQILGQIGETIWTATVTHRHEETIRIISVRHARADEKARYVEGSGEGDYG